MRKWLLSLALINAAILLVFLLVGILGDKAVTSFHEKTTGVPSRCFVIDAGHGGVDGGATSCTGVLESNINLEIALRLNDLMHLLGMETVMIRSTDVSVYTSGNSIAQKKISDLKQRVRMVNLTKNAVLVSIHQNYFGDGRYSGPQVFYAPNQHSRILAGDLQTKLVQTLKPGSHRQAKKADGIYLMEKITCPGVLIECGFLSNAEEEACLRNAGYQKDLCCTIASVLSNYHLTDEIA